MKYIVVAHASARSLAGDDAFDVGEELADVILRRRQRHCDERERVERATDAAQRVLTRLRLALISMNRTSLSADTGYAEQRRSAGTARMNSGR